MRPLTQLIQAIDLYCERTAPGLLSEPLNALSNVAFILAALYAFRLWRAQAHRSPLDLGLIVLAGLIAVGSFLFHTFANSATELADVIPIWSFVALFVLTIIYRMTGSSLFKTARIAGIAVAITAIVMWFTAGDITTEADTGPGLFNGSLQYAPALASLLGFALIAMLRGHPARFHVLAAAAMFFTSLVFRTLDLAVCAATYGIGTHFMWHVLNAAMVGILLVVLLKFFPPQMPRAS